MSKKYFCSLSISKECEYGGSKKYNYGFFVGTGSYCRLYNLWISDMNRCPAETKTLTNE